MKTYLKWWIIALFCILLIYLNIFDKLYLFYNDEIKFSKLILDTIWLLINIYSIILWFLWVWISLILSTNSENIKLLKDTEVKNTNISYFDKLIWNYKFSIYIIFISLILSIISFFLFDILLKKELLEYCFYLLLFLSILTFVSFEKIIRNLFLVIKK